MTRLHPKYKTPKAAILLIGLVSSLAPLLGRPMLVWLSNAGGLAVVLAYLVVVISFVILKKREPEMDRPYNIRNWKFVGTMAIGLTSIMFLLYMPGMPSALGIYEWGIILAWVLFGVVLFGWRKLKKN